MREQKLIIEYFSNYRARGIARLRELHRTGQLEQTLNFFDRANSVARAAGLTDAGFHNCGNAIDVRECIENPDYQ